MKTQSANTAIRIFSLPLFAESAGQLPKRLLKALPGIGRGKQHEFSTHSGSSKFAWNSTMTAPQTISVQVGQRQNFAASDAGPAWESAIIKTRVDNPVLLSATGLTGDEQADRRHHGGTDKAVLAYAAQHFPSWHSVFPSHKFSAGAFGEEPDRTGDG